MWEESWPNLLMKMKDMPYYKYKPSKPEHGKKSAFKEDTDGAKQGDIDVLQKKFAKYIKQ